MLSLEFCSSDIFLPSRPRTGLATAYITVVYKIRNIQNATVPRQICVVSGKRDLTFLKRIIFFVGENTVKNGVKATIKANAPGR